MTRTIEMVYDNKVELEYFADDISTHYILDGERFKHDKELLKLISKFGGACTEDPKAHSLTINCDFNCMDCPKSIYTILKKQEKFFYAKCNDLCKREPKAGDEWEVSLVSYEGFMPKYQDYYCRCLDGNSGKSIIEMVYEIMKLKYPKFYAQSKYCYIKIRRFDMDRPVDVSMIGNQYFKAFLDGKFISDIPICIEEETAN